MPKVTKSTGQKISDLLAKRNAGDVFRRAGDRIFCTVCCTQIGVRKSILEQYLKTLLHQSNASRKQKQMQLEDSLESHSSIGVALVEAFLAADIPLNKLENPLMKSFLGTYLPCNVGSVSTMRQKYVDILYQNLLNKDRSYVEGKFNQINRRKKTKY